MLATELSSPQWASPTEPSCPPTAGAVLGMAAAAAALTTITSDDLDERVQTLGACAVRQFP